MDIKNEVLEDFGAEKKTRTSEHEIVGESSKKECDQLAFPPIPSTSPNPPLRQRKRSLKQFPQKLNKSNKLATGDCGAYTRIKLPKTKQVPKSKSGGPSIGGKINSLQSCIKDNQGLGLDKHVNSYRTGNHATNKHAINQQPISVSIQLPNPPYNQLAVTHPPP